VRLDRYFFGESFEWVSALELGQLFGRVLINELVDGQEPSADSNLDVVFLNFDGHSPLSEFIHALRLTHKHDLEFGAVRAVVDVLGQLQISRVSFDWDVNSDTRLQINHILPQRVHMLLCLFQLFQDREGILVGLCAVFFQSDDIPRCCK